MAKITELSKEERVNRILKMRRRGVPVPEIAEKLGMGTIAVYNCIDNRLQKLKVKQEDYLREILDCQLGRLQEIIANHFERGVLGEFIQKEDGTTARVMSEESWKRYKFAEDKLTVWLTPLHKKSTSEVNLTFLQAIQMNSYTEEEKEDMRRRYGIGQDGFLPIPGLNAKSIRAVPQAGDNGVGEGV